MYHWHPVELVIWMMTDWPQCPLMTGSQTWMSIRVRDGLRMITQEDLGSQRKCMLASLPAQSYVHPR